MATNGKILKQITHQNVVLLIVIITIMVNVLKTGRCIILKIIRGSQKIKCSFYQSNVRKNYDHLYACEWKVDGSGSMLSPDVRIEVINTEDSVDVEVTNTPNTPYFKEQQNIAINRYNHLHKVEEESFQIFMKNNKMKCKLPETKRQSLRISMNLIDMVNIT